MRRISWVALGLCALLGPALHAAENSSGYKLLKKIKVGGDGGWDYLTMDADSHRLYISRGNRVMVVDVEDGKVVGEVPKTPGVHGIALVPERHRGFISNGGENTVTIFDTKTLREVNRIKVGTGPDGIIYDPACKRVFTMNGRSQDATAIDAEKEEVVGTVKLGGKPESVVADGKGHLFVDVENKDEVAEFDGNKLEVLNRYSVAPVKAPAGLAMDRKTRRLFVTCHNPAKMVVLNADDGKVVATLPIGQGTDAARFDDETGLAFSSNGDGTLSVIKEEGPDKFVALDPVKTERGARTMDLDTKTHRIYLVTAKFKMPAPGQQQGRGGQQQGRGGRGGRGGFRFSLEPNSFVVLVVGKE
jgi:YVTN family beta-propeller protein